jgi:hypothetical protein
VRNEDKTTTLFKRREAQSYEFNRAIAWCGFCLGVLTGSAMGLWAFDGPVSPPPGMTDYQGTARRLMRLGHIAFFGIGFLNLLLAVELPRLPLGDNLKRAAARAMNTANIFLPTLLMAAALLPPVKYLLPLPVMAATVALAIAAFGAVRNAYAARSASSETATQTL